jgi:anti-sigma factor RsiW
MTCEELLGYLSNYIDHELNETLTQAAQAHLATCPNCQVVLNTTQRVMVLGRGQHQRVIPRERRERLFAQLQTAFLQRPRASEDEPTEG